MRGSACRPSRAFGLVAGLIVVLAAASAGLVAQAVPESRFSALHWRLVGPFRGGWATAVAGIPGNATTFHFGSADGGVWQTTDAGVTWRPLWVGTAETSPYAAGPSAAIGALAVAPGNPRVIWAGTGHVQQRWDIVDGDGVYRSTDGGETWTHVGLADTRHVGAIWVDPRSADVALVAALGHVFGPNEQRGIFRTEDGGRTWTKVLYRDADTGAVSIARSDDGGMTWTRINPDSGLASDYMSGVVPDPRNADIVWTMGRSLHRSQDGGKSLTLAKGSPGGDDYHRLWIDPTDPQRMITGADQGAVVTVNRGRTWSSWYNQPTGQFYRLATNSRFPYWIYSGQQDSGTVAIASRSDYGQITFRDWHPVGGDERDGDVPDPTNPDIVYGAGLGGRVSKWNARTGAVQNVTPWPVSSYGGRPGTSRYRYSWITPLAISARPPHAIYTAAQVLFRSMDGGQSWKTISRDLTGARGTGETPVPQGMGATGGTPVPQRGTAPAKGCEGDVPVERATACGWGVIFAIAPSPAAGGLVWIGTDSGRVHVTRDDGVTWTDVTPPGMKDWTKVNIIDTSATDPGTAYVAADRHRLDDFRPFAWRTHDFGKTWTEIGRGLPDGAWVGAVREDPKRRGLLFAGTSRGVHVSFDDGENWQSVQLDLPRTGINDLLVKGDDVIVATQGRGIWALDGIGPLRAGAGAQGLKPLGLQDGGTQPGGAQAAGAETVLLPPATAHRLRANSNKDTPLPPEEPRGENPPVGAVVDHVLATPKPAGEGAAPGGQASPVVIEIAASDGTIVRRFSSADAPKRPNADLYFADSWLAPPNVPGTKAGHNRFVWDLRHPAPRALEYEYSIAAVPGRAVATPEGAFVLPGKYEVRVVADGRTLRQPLTVVMDPRVTTSQRDLAVLLAFQREVEAELARSADLAAATGTEEATKENAAATNAVLAALARDLESADLPPTQPQRDLLTQCRQALRK
jgi:photosystem II stability/assembly factor-like uncharacterized protein